jgi:hypothetical protein
MSDDNRYRSLPFAPWATDVGAKRDLEEKLALLHQAVAACQERPPSEPERDAIAWLAVRDPKLAGYCRQLAAAMTLPHQEQRQAQAAAVLGKIKRWVGYGA